MTPASKWNLAFCLIDATPWSALQTNERFRDAGFLLLWGQSLIHSPPVSKNSLYMGAASSEESVLVFNKTTRQQLPEQINVIYN